MLMCVYVCLDGSRSDAEKMAAGLDVSGNEKPSFSKATVILPSRTMLPTFARTPPPSSLVIGMPRFDQKLEEITAERKAARCAAEAMANLSVLPVAAMSLPPSASSSVNSLQSAVAVASERRGSPLTTAASSSAVVPMDVEPSDAADALLPSQMDKYSSYDRHFKKKFFGSERRTPSSEPVPKVGDVDQPAGDGGRDENMPSPDVTSTVACKKARLAEPGHVSVSPLCVTDHTPTPAVSGTLLSTATTSAVTVSQPSFVRLTGNDTSRGSPSCVRTTTPVSSAAADSDSGVAPSTACTGESSPHTESGVVDTQSAHDGGCSQPNACLSEQTADEQTARTETSLP